MLAAAKKQFVSEKDPGEFPISTHLSLISPLVVSMERAKITYLRS